MTKHFFTLGLILIYHLGTAQTITESLLVGEWEFIELRDEFGKKQTEIPINGPGKSMIEKVNRNSYIFYEDGTYKSFNPYNTSYGTWFFDEQSQEINLELRIEKSSPLLPSLKKVRIVKKRKDGFYYQKPVQQRILTYSTDSMTIADREKYILLYKRKQ